MRRIVAVAVVALALAFLGQASSPALSQGEIVVTNDSVENRFPDGLLFRLAASGDSPISDVRLRYRIGLGGVLSSAQPDFNLGTSVNVSFTLEGEVAPDLHSARCPHRIFLGVDRRSRQYPGLPILQRWTTMTFASIGRTAPRAS